MSDYKLFDEIDKTHLYDGIDIDEASIQAIDDWFYNRRICDNTHFDRYFRRKLKNSIGRYNQLIRIEYTEFDPLVSAYHESWTNVEGTHEGSSSESGSYSKEGNSTDNHQTTFNDTIRKSGTVVTDSDSTQSSSGSSDSDTKTLQRALPAAGLSYGSAGLPSNLNWNTASGQEENKTGNSDNSSGTSATDTTVTNNLSDAHTGNNVVAGTTGNSEEGSDSKASSNSGTDNTETMYISAGRDGLTPQEALLKAMEYIRQSRAFDWLKDELETCFISVYDI